ncbi:hypothetical protein IKQ21_09900 [bacterium]|nr:hypothetical protein [bacterium]
MEENQQTNLAAEPEKFSDNSCGVEKTNPESVSDDGGKSAPDTGADPSKLILGKFKSQEDLINAYQQLEKLQGSQSSELGNLRQNAVWMSNIQEAWKQRDELMNCAKELQSAAQKYNTPEYFQDPSFKAMYKEAYLALGKNLDTDRFVNLLEGYVSSRLMKYQQEESAKNETKSAIGGMKFDKNKVAELKPTGKRIDEMTEDEINAILDKYI